jgi:hypothetical protein
MKRIVGIVMSMVVASVVGCGDSKGTAEGGGAGIAPSSSSSGPRRPQVRGFAAFEEQERDPLSGKPTVEHALHGARVELIDATGAVVTSGAVLVGDYALDLPEGASASGLRVRVSTTSAYAGAPELSVTSNGAVCAWTVPVADGPNTDIVVPLSLSGPFDAFTAAVWCAAFVTERFEPGATLPPVELKAAEAGASHYDPATRVISLAPDDDRAELVVGHCMGHHVLSTFGKDDRPVSPHYLEGSWTPDQDLDPRLAFSEAWATWFSARCGHAWKDTSVVERPATLGRGPGSEGCVLAAIFDLFDGGEWKDDDQDGAFVPEAALWRATKALRTRAHVDISDFAALLIADGAIDATAWNAAFGYLGLSLPMPELGTAIAKGAVVRGTVDATLGQESLRAASVFYRVTVPVGSGPLEVVMTPTSLFDPLKLIVWAPDGSGGVVDPYVLFSQQTVTIDAPVAGEWLIQVRAGEYPIGSPVAGFEVRTR